MCLIGAVLSTAVSITNMPPPYYSVYSGAVGASARRQMEYLAMPLKENVLGNNTYINTRRYILGPDNKSFLITDDGSGLAEDGKLLPEALRLQAKTSTNDAEINRCLSLAEWLEGDRNTPSPRALTKMRALQFVKKASSLPRPRVFADAQDFAELKLKSRSDALVDLGVRKAIADADRWMNEEPSEYRLNGYVLLEVSRKTVSRLVSFAFAWQMTGDRKYVKSAEEELLAVCSFKDWNPRHTIDTGEMMTAVAIAYDWMYDAISPSVREKTARALEVLGLESDVPFAGWTRLQNNWIQVVSAGMVATVAAIADRCPDKCAEYLLAVVESLPEAECVTAPDGVYPEGPGYWNYGNIFNAIALEIFNKIGDDFGLTRVKGFLETATFPHMVTGPSGYSFNYSDSHGTLGGGPATWWFARRHQIFNAVTARDVESFKDICSDTGVISPRTFPFTLFWVGEDIMKAPRSLLPDIWVGGGEMPIGVISGGRADDENAYIAIKGGSPSYNHAHADEGSFVLDIMKERWAFDLGAENYREVEKVIGGSGLWSVDPLSKRWGVFRIGTQSHNTLMIGGEGQSPCACASLTRVGNAVIVDMSNVYPKAKKVIRSVSAKGKSVILKDKIEANANVEVRWAMLTDAEISHNSGVVLSKNGKSLGVKVQGADVNWKIESASPGNDYEKRNEGFRLLTFTALVPKSGSLELEVNFAPVESTCL